ncbi:MAG TPA: AMP-binding protein [Pseudonocardia sp.]|nr:AMP-binding protein [Pseudonocardia sp.]
MARPAEGVRRTGQRATDWVDYNARRYPNEPALESADTGTTQTWAQTEYRVARLAGVLAERLGVRRGDRVAVLADNDPRVLEVQFACWRLGAVFVPLNWRLAPPELEAMLADAEPAVLVHDAKWAETASALAGAVPALACWATPDGPLDLDAAAERAQPRPPSLDNLLDQPAQLLYTSGTTGRPKAAITTFSTLVWNALNIAGPARVTGAGDRHLAALPLFHAGGLNGVTNPVLLSGGCARVASRFDPGQVLGLLGDPRSGVTHFSGAPVMYLMMSGLPGFDGADFSGMRYGQLGGGYLEGELAGRYAERGVHLLPSYGATEMGPSATTMTVAAAPHKIGSCGFPVQHTQLRVVDEGGNDVAPGEVGEVWVRGPSILPGYWRRDPATDPAFHRGWFRSGDAMRIDPDGFCHLTGRFKDMYKSGGENVFAAEVEDVLVGHPDIAEIGIIGVADPKWGEVGRAVVVVRGGAAVTVDSITAFAADKLAAFKLPRSVVTVAALDRNSSGKVVKGTLKQKYGDVS